VSAAATTGVVVLDMDGVILQSNAVKGEAMVALFADQPQDVRARIDAWNRAHGGVRRDDKLRHILSDILGHRSDDDAVAGYLDRYARALKGAIDRAPLVPGIDAFLAGGRHVFYVSSSAPEDELREQLARRGLAPYVARAFGADTPKPRALRAVRARHPQADIVFFGDAVADLQATRDAPETCVAFVGVTCEQDHFGDRDIARIADFHDIEAVDRAWARALQALRAIPKGADPGTRDPG
jgi:phosphoglycolate phosphatase-like HAD superfamily hydrolase